MSGCITRTPDYESHGNPGIPRVPRINLVGMKAVKPEIDFSPSMWQHKSRSERRTLCMACEEKKHATVHKCDACQALFLGVGVSSRYPWNIPLQRWDVPGNPGIPKVSRVNLDGMKAAKPEVDFSTSMWQNKKRSERRLSLIHISEPTRPY